MISSSSVFLRGTLMGALALAAAAARAVQVETSSGLHVAVDAASGCYELHATPWQWTFAGDCGGPVTDVAATHGQDAIGRYQEIAFAVGGPAKFDAAIRAYEQSPVLLFTIKTSQATAALPPFPAFKRVPGGLHPFSYKHQMFSPPSFTLESVGTPWLLFDDSANAAILSPADHFMVATMVHGAAGELASGFNPGVRDFPAGFAHRTLLTLGHGINATWDQWSAALLALTGKKRPANDADIGLRYYGYWTDNGAAYYYNYDRRLGYAETLRRLVARYREEGIPIRYLQLDSWWYYKTLTAPDGTVESPKKSDLPLQEWNRYGGLIKYEAHPGVFPAGLAAFQRSVGLPLITHNRWIDPASPYHQKYKISGVAAIDPHWWDDTIRYVADAGVVCYEQDWLNEIYDHSPELRTDLAAGDLFTDNMARAAKERGLSVQYCMCLPWYYLQGAKYDNVTTIRPSEDRLERSKWDWFLYTSRLATSVGIWPWTDVFMSSETDNLLVATLSAGMVGTGDELGSENKANLLWSVRPDGVIVKPDVSLLPLDQNYIAAANGRKSPMVAYAHTDHPAFRTAYVFCYQTPGGDRGGEFVPKDLGLVGDVAVYDVRGGSAVRQPATKPFRFTLAEQGSAYFVVVPVMPDGLAFLGDTAKFVSNGRQRIASLAHTGRRLTADVAFSVTEQTVELFGYAPTAPKIAATRGAVKAETFDPATGRFTITVAPSFESTRDQFGDMTRGATVTIE